MNPSVALDPHALLAIARRVGDDPVALSNAAWLAARRGAPAVARTLLERALALPGAPRAARAGLQALGASEPERLVLTPEGVPPEPHPVEPDALLAEGRALLERGDVRASLARFDEVLRMRPSDTLALFHRGVALAKLRRYGDALADWSQVEAHEPASALAAMSRRHLRSARRLAHLFAAS